MHRLRYRFLSRLTVVALLATLSGQIAVAGHAALADHGIAERCDVCIGANRLSHGLVQAESEIPIATPVSATPLVVPVTVIPARPVSREARAPPVL